MKILSLLVFVSITTSCTEGNRVLGIAKTKGDRNEITFVNRQEKRKNRDLAKLETEKVEDRLKKKTKEFLKHMRPFKDLSFEVVDILNKNRSNLLNEIESDSAKNIEFTVELSDEMMFSNVILPHKTIVSGILFFNVKPQRIYLKRVTPPDFILKFSRFECKPLFDKKYFIVNLDWSFENGVLSVRECEATKDFLISKTQFKKGSLLFISSRNPKESPLQKIHYIESSSEVTVMKNTYPKGTRFCVTKEKIIPENQMADQTCGSDSY